MDIIQTKNKRKTRKNINENEIQELRDLLLKQAGTKSKSVPIIYDSKHTRQYSLKIPKKLAEAANIDPQKDEFQFTLAIPPDPSQPAELSGKLIRK